jgi:uncharacterized protein YegP (UPF0339 family)
MARAEFEIYVDNAGRWRWRLRAKNGKLLANGGQGFASKPGVLRSLKSVRKAVAKARPKPAEIEPAPVQPEV